MSEPPCARRGVPDGQTENGYSTRRLTLEPVRPEAVLPDRVLYLLRDRVLYFPTLSHFLNVNKLFSLSLSLSLSLPFSLSLSLSLSHSLFLLALIG